MTRDLLSSPSPGGGGSTAERSEGSRGGVRFPYFHKRSPHPARHSASETRVNALMARDPPPPGEGEACALAALSKRPLLRLEAGDLCRFPRVLEFLLDVVGK